MKNKNGFTLIELLAVIVILAIIALIATPTVLSAIGDARARANKESARGYLDAMKLYCARQLTSSPTAAVPTWAAAKAAVTYNGAAVSVTADTATTFTSGCDVTDSALRLNTYSISDLNS